MVPPSGPEPSTAHAKAPSTEKVDVADRPITFLPENRAAHDPKTYAASTPPMSLHPTEHPRHTDRLEERQAIEVRGSPHRLE